MMLIILQTSPGSHVKASSCLMVQNAFNIPTLVATALLISQQIQTYHKHTHQDVMVPSRSPTILNINLKIERCCLEIAPKEVATYIQHVFLIWIRYLSIMEESSQLIWLPRPHQQLNWMNKTSKMISSLHWLFNSRIETLILMGIYCRTKWVHGI